MDVLNYNFIRLGLTRGNQPVGFQEKHAVASLYRNQMRLPWSSRNHRLSEGVFWNIFGKKAEL